MATELRSQVRSASAGRDRVLDAAKAAALLLVVVGHSLAWDVSSGTPTNVLGARPESLVWLTWVFQLLPLFFAAGAVANAGSWARTGTASAFWRRRMLRLGAPALVYVTVWTTVLLALAPWVPSAADVGRFLAQLLWFLGVYCAVVLAVPLTSRWTRRPWLTLSVWAAAVLVVDALRWNVDGSFGWLNLLLVWGLMHQIGYHLPALRRAPTLVLVAGAGAALAAAIGLAVAGPYSTSLVSYAGDPEPSNLSPPTVVLALHGVALVLLLAACSAPLGRVLAADRRFVVAAVGVRGVGLYLWHIPFVAIVTGVALGLGFPAAPLSALWWAAHGVGLVAVAGCAWLVAGLAGRADRALSGMARGTPARPAVVLAAVALPLVLLNVSVTGFGTWWGPSMVDQVSDGRLSAPTSALLNLALLAGTWLLLACGPRPRAD